MRVFGSTAFSSVFHGGCSRPDLLESGAWLFLSQFSVKRPFRAPPRAREQRRDLLCDIRSIRTNNSDSERRPYSSPRPTSYVFPADSSGFARGPPGKTGPPASRKTRQQRSDPPREFSRSIHTSIKKRFLSLNRCLLT